MSRAFVDTHVLLYGFGEDHRRERARAVVELGGVISVQSLNEFVHVARRKLGFAWPEVALAIDAIRTFFPTIISLDGPMHDDARRLAERYRLSIYDAMIVAAALQAQCDLLWSEDMHAGLVLDDRLRIVNPFA